jgi:acetyl-CoA synthetase
MSLEARLAPGRSWDALRAGFAWEIPERFNIAEALVGGWARAEPERLALIHLRGDGAVERWRHVDLDRAARRLANALAARGVGRGDRVAVLLPQSPETLILHLAAYRLAAIAVPLFTLFGEEGLAYRLADSGAVALVTDAANLPKIAAIRDRLPDLRLVLCTDGPAEGADGWAETLARASDAQTPAVTGPEDPAFLSYTSGTTGPPKGALHAHRCLIGHLPGVRLVHDFLPQPGDVMWTPADWAWMGGLCNVMMPALYWGVPLISHRMEKFDPERAFRLMAEQGVTCAFFPPTALKLMRTVARPERFGLRLRTLGSGGEALGAELLAWGKDALGVEIAEFYGQTECNKVLANNPAIMAVKPGSMGRAVPGYDIAILDAEGRELPPGETGEIAMRRGGASMFLGYWGLPEKTAEKFVGDWLRSGDEGRMDGQGYVFFSSRTDDVITSSGYRIGPSEVEDCLSGHPAVAMAAVVGLPDPVRTEIVAAFVTLRPGAPKMDDALREALASHVRARLGAHVAPRRVEQVEALPTTATGKIMRREIKRRAVERG